MVSGLFVDADERKLDLWGFCCQIFLFSLVLVVGSLPVVVDLVYFETVLF